MIRISDFQSDTKSIVVFISKSGQTLGIPAILGVVLKSIEKFWKVLKRRSSRSTTTTLFSLVCDNHYIFILGILWPKNPISWATSWNWTEKVRNVECLIWSLNWSVYESLKYFMSKITLQGDWKQILQRKL